MEDHGQPQGCLAAAECQAAEHSSVRGHQVHGQLTPPSNWRADARGDKRDALVTVCMQSSGCHGPTVDLVSRRAHQRPSTAPRPDPTK